MNETIELLKQLSKHKLATELSLKVGIVLGLGLMIGHKSVQTNLIIVGIGANFVVKEVKGEEKISFMTHAAIQFFLKKIISVRQLEQKNGLP